MNEHDDFQAELENLLNDEQRRVERERSPRIYLESLEPERRRVVDVYNAQHMGAVGIFEDVTFEHFNATVDTRMLYDKNEAISNVVMAELESHEILHEGEVQFSGNVMLVDYQNEDGLPQHLSLTSGDVVRGEIDGYEIVSLVADDKVTVDHTEMPGIWANLTNVNAYLVGGEIVHLSEVQVKINNPGVMMHRVVHETEDMLRGTSERQSEIDYKELLSGDVFRDFCNDLENDLRHNEYEADEIAVIRHEQQVQINEMLASMSQDERYLLSAHNVTPMVRDKVFSITERVAYYSGTTIVNIYGTYRVAHSFNLVNESEEQMMVYVFPESIQAIERQTEL